MRRKLSFPAGARVSSMQWRAPARSLFTKTKSAVKPRARKLPVLPSLVAGAGLLLYGLFPRNRYALNLQPDGKLGEQKEEGNQKEKKDQAHKLPSFPTPFGGSGDESDAWFNFTSKFQGFSDTATLEWSQVSDKIVDFILPDWSKMMPDYIRKLQQELSESRSSLADEIWRDAHDPLLNPEVQYEAHVRVSDDLCKEEKAFRERRKRTTAVALARYLGLDPKEVHPDDVPVIALCGSGGGLRALVAGTGSMLSCKESGLFDCATYTGGVSGSCWLQTLYNSSISQQQYSRIVDHLKARLGVHIAYPPTALSLLTSAPTNKVLLSGVVEKLKGDPKAGFGLVDVYGILLATRLLVPKGELAVNEADFKISNQREYIKRGENPMPIYTAVRHEIPDLDTSSDKDAKLEGASESAKEEAKKKAWFQWFEVTPYEFFCEEFSAGIPTWALGRKFRGGRDVPPADEDYHLPETRLSLLLGVFGSAFCATLSHYYKEIRPVVRSLTGFGPLDEMISDRNEDLSKVHPIDPAILPNPVYGMKAEQLPSTVPPGILAREYIQLMDAGMSNNLPLYPFLRPGRGVEVVVVFDASADIKNDNWLSVADGYARQRGVKGWPIGVGWPKDEESVKTTKAQLEKAQASSEKEASQKVEEAKANDAKTANANSADSKNAKEQSDKIKKTLGYCTVWVGSSDEKVATPLDKDTHWRLTAPDAGLTLVYLPYLANEKKAPGVDPATSEFMSTWNFVYTPEQVDSAIALAKANFSEGSDQIRNTVRAVYERKKQQRLDAIKARQESRYRRMVRLGLNDRLVGDDFS